MAGLRGESYVFHRFAYRTSKPWVGLGFGVGVIGEMAEGTGQPLSVGMIDDAVWNVFRKRMMQEAEDESFELIEKMYCETATMPQLATSNFKGITIPIETKVQKDLRNLNRAAFQFDICKFRLRGNMKLHAVTGKSLLAKR